MSRDPGGPDEPGGPGEREDDHRRSSDSGDGRVAGTVCPFCAVGCRLDRRDDRNGAGPADDAAVAVRGREGPANPDGRLCEQGLHAFDSVGATDRLTDPLVRDGGELVAVDWETAIERAVAGFERVCEEHGPDALAFLGAPQCTNEENYLLQKLARALGTNNVDNRARRCHAATARAVESRLGFPAATNGLADLRRADVFLVVGANPAARQPVAFDSVVRPAVADGATLVHVDPHANETTRVADHHLAPRPGTDALVATLLSALVVARGDIDREFVAERTSNFDAFRESLVDYGAPPAGGGGGAGETDEAGDPAAIAAGAATADVPVDSLRTVARTVGGAERATVLTGTGVDERATADALLNLCLLTGNVGRAGTGLNLLRGLANEQGASDVGCAPDRLPGHQPVDDAAARARVEEVWGRSVPSTPGKTERELVEGFGEGVRAALVVGENPALSKRGTDEVARGLDALDALVVTELAPTETTARADVVFPAAAGVETGGTVTNLDRQVQRRRPLVDPPDSVRTDFDILRELGRRLVGEGFAPPTQRAAFAELTAVTPVYAGLSYDGLGRRSRRWPTEGAAEPGGSGGSGERADASAGEGSVLYRESFRTADGRAPFVAVEPSPATGPAASADRDALALVVTDRAGGFEPGGGTRGDRRGDEALVVHPADAAARGVDDGERVVVATDGAAVETTARATTAVRRGTVALHASVADPLVRASDGGRIAVTLRSGAGTTAEAGETE